MRRKGYAICSSLIGFAAVLAGCTGAQYPEGTLTGLGGGRVNISGPVQTLDPDQIERVDLIALLDPYNLRARLAIGTPPDRGMTKIMGIDAMGTVARNRKGDNDTVFDYIDPSSELARAIVAFHYVDSGKKDGNGMHIYDIENYSTLKMRRNYIQNAVIAASDQRCNVYIGYLYRSKAANEFYLGSLSTLLGGMGAIFTAPDTVRALSGSSAIIGGIRSEHSQAYFTNLATRVITEGIRAAREDFLKGLRGSVVTTVKVEKQTAEGAPTADATTGSSPTTPVAGSAGATKASGNGATSAAAAAKPAAQTGVETVPAKVSAPISAPKEEAVTQNDERPSGGYMSQSIEDYPITAAIADAIRYHGLCSVVTGLDKASRSITEVQSPGPAQVKAVLQSTLETTQAVQKIVDEVNKNRNGGGANGNGG